MLDSIQDTLARIAADLLARPDGTLSFRFVLQPTMAALLAIGDGIKDARTGRSPYFWTILTDAQQRGERFREGIAATARIMVLGLIMDAIYQIMEFRKFYPGEAVIVAIGLAFVPYFLIRGPVARIASWWHKHHAASEHTRPSKH